MADVEVIETRPAPPRREPRMLAAVSAWLLLAACLVLLVIGLVAGERVSTYDELRAAVAAGDVDEVVVTGGLDGGFIGRQTVTVHWREGVFRYQAPAVEQHPQRRTDTRAGVAVVDSVQADLAEQHSGVQVERRPHDYPDYNEVFGWRLPAWTQTATVVIALVGLLLLIGGPEPRGATRWAWFWLMAVAPPLGFLAFLVISGFLSPRPRTALGYRLTGGKAFLLAFLVSAALDAVASAFL
jgi:hypothetical protein